MRAIDWDLAVALKSYWKGGELPEGVCPLLADLDRLVTYLDEIGLRPGDALTPCPVCGEWHRWTLLRELLFCAVELRPENHCELLQIIGKAVEAEHAYFGGKEKHEKYLSEADAYFKKIGATDNVYTL